MKKFFLLAILAVSCTSLVGCMDPPITTGVDVDNLNTGSTDDPLIRVWVLSEEEIANPPTTKAEAQAIENLVTYPFNIYQFRRAPGTYFVVASNETHFQNLSPNDAFVAGTDFSLLEVEVADGQGFLSVAVENTDTPTKLPEITEL